jgi:hypothetical protein
MKLLILFYLLLIISSQVFAKKVALTIGGTSNSNQDFQHHEFARGFLARSEGLKAKGYEVHTLFSEKGLDRSNILNSDDFDIRNRQTEESKYAEDYAQIEKRFPKTKASTSKNIIETLDAISKSLKSGDTFTLNLNAHGHCVCDGQNNNSLKVAFGDCPAESDYDSRCHHEIDVFDEQGHPTRFKTKEIIDRIKVIESKGVEVNLLADSCFSGLLKQEIKDLKNTCTFMTASGDFYGFSCFENDPPESFDYTATSEYIGFSMYADINDELVKDDYFKNSKCHNKVYDHAKKLGLTGKESISEIFWKARSEDRCLGESSLSSILNFSYFDKGRFSKGFHNYTQEICLAEIITPLQSLSDLVTDVTKANFNRDFEELKEAIGTYNKNIENQKMIKSKFSKVDRASSEYEVLVSELEKLQQSAETLAQDVLERERVILGYYQGVKSENVNCDRRF